MQKAGIIGCGWLGFPLAKKLIIKGFEVKGTTTRHERTAELGAFNIEPFQFQLGESIPKQFFKDLDVVVICFPVSSRHSENQYEQFIQDLASKIDSTTALIFTSSISVYLPFQGEINETNGVLDTNAINTKFEKLLKKHLVNKITILRLGGLIGDDRHPVHFLAGRANIEHGDAPINLVHQNDVIQIIENVISQAKFNEIFNCVYPYHPQKKEYYTKLAVDLGLAPPTFVTNGKNHKIVVGQKVCSNVLFSYKLCP